jgi:glutamate synthase domain-containing protein 3
MKVATMACPPADGCTPSAKSQVVALEPVLSAAEQELKVPQAVWHQGRSDEEILRQLISAHHKWTGSLRARHILDHWADSRAKFVKVFPHEYRRALGEMAAKGETTQVLAKARLPEVVALPSAVLPK